MSVSFAYDETYPGPALPVLDLTIAGGDAARVQTVKGLVDSGADATLVPSAILSAAGVRKIDEAWARTVSGERYSVSVFAATVIIGVYVLHAVELLANDKTDETIVGRDVLNQLIVTLDGPASVVEVSA